MIDKVIEASPHAGEVCQGAAQDRGPPLESALSEGEQQFRLLVEGVPGYAFFMLDPVGRVATWNRGAERLTLWAPEEILGQPFSVLFMEQDTAAGLPARELDRARAAGRHEIVGCRKRRDGGIFQAHATITALCDEAGELRGYVKVMRDITAQKLAEGDLLASEARLRAVVDTAVDAIIVMSDQGVVESFNPAAERVFGYAASEVIGRNVSMLMPEPYRSAHDGYLARYRETGEARIIGRGREVEGRRRNGSTFPADLSVAEWRVGETRHFTGILRDITERRRSEDHLRLVIRELSHRTKNVLAVVQAMAWQTARTSDDIRDFERRFTLRLNALARSHDLLVIGEWRGVALDALVRSQLAPFLDSAEKRLVIEGPAVSLKPAMAQELGLALHELATNASKYGALSRPEGRIHLNWEISGERFCMNWRESGGPRVSPPQKEGLGHMIISAMKSADCDVSLEFAPEGVVWRLAAAAEETLSRDTLNKEVSK